MLGLAAGSVGVAVKSDRLLAINGVFISILTELLHRSRDISEKRNDDFLQANEQLKKEIEDRKRAEESLRESESRLRSIFLAAPVGIGLVSSRSLVDVNDTLCRMTGYSWQELIGKSSRT
ncbi:PAS domain S-box protein, partial [bacterium]